jgi:hypothetical protein
MVRCRRASQFKHANGNYAAQHNYFILSASVYMPSGFSFYGRVQTRSAEKYISNHAPSHLSLGFIYVSRNQRTLCAHRRAKHFLAKTIDSEQEY